jgi:REP element-mobilizing transposase RayT
MARPLRIAYPGAFYHVTARGNERRKIFLSKADYVKFLSYCADAAHKYGVILHAFVLMGNHYHLIVETPDANLSAFAHAINSAYTTYFNIKRKRAGHLFQGRYKSIVIEKDSYLLELSRYIHLNPVRAGIVQRPEDYNFSSYRSYIVSEEETIVSREVIWGMISKKRNKAPARYKSFVESAISEPPPDPFKRVYGGVILGKAPFIKDVLKQTAEIIPRQETAQRRVLSSSASGIDEIVHVLSLHFNVTEETVLSTSPYRSYALYLARKHTPVSSTDIGRAFGGITCSAVTKMGARLKERMEKDKALRKEIGRIEEKLSYVNADP